MRGDESAFAALGLRPGAKPAEVDEAYRRLIKQYHPDRTGGDGRRAAEINHAYRVLRRQGLQVARPRTVPMAVHMPERRPRPRKREWLLTVLVLGIAGAGLANEDLRSKSVATVPRLPIAWPQADESGVRSPAMPWVDFDEPLHVAVIDGAISDAARLDEVGTSDAATDYSRDCRNKIRKQPSLALFDACAAFDEAMIALADEDVATSGAFSGSEVMAREMAAARILSDDMLGADSRLHRIRTRVEMALLPRLDPPAADVQP